MNWKEFVGSIALVVVVAVVGSYLVLLFTPQGPR